MTPAPASASLRIAERDRQKRQVLEQKGGQKAAAQQAAEEAAPEREATDAGAEGQAGRWESKQGYLGHLRCFESKSKLTSRILIKSIYHESYSVFFIC